MTTLDLKPSHKPVREYYAELSKLTDLGLEAEGAVAPAFANLLRSCGRQFKLTLGEQFPIKRKNGQRIVVDGALLDDFKLPHGYWEAKDSKDDLRTEVKKKFAKAYPKDNILFQAPDHLILVQDGQEVFNQAKPQPEALVEVLKLFFEYRPPEFEQWEQAVEEFKDQVPALAKGVLELIEQERKSNKAFVKAFEGFSALCRQSINPNLSAQAVEEMLIQHLLTERIFRKVFNNPDFVERNVVAHQIEKVIRALTSKYFSKEEFQKKLDRFYVAIESTAATIDDYSQKQAFLNTVYEKFFQGFSIKVADTHGIVYTPQPIVDFMVRSVEEILQKEFGRSLSDEGVHVLDPFVGTGNFILRVMREVQRTALARKFAHELHCNEVMLLPYYIASMNIEHAYYELTGEYKPFEGLCLVDTFELAEPKEPSLFNVENTERVQRQQKAPIFVILGNPPYNAFQVNENDNNKNRKYPVIDKRVAQTYAKDSKATNKNALSDVYVKAYRWASDRIGDEGIIAFVSNNSFVDQLAFDGMRQHLAKDFDSVYVLDLGGNVRKNPKLSGTTHNVFGIQVGVSINLLVRKKAKSKQPARIFYARCDEFWTRWEKYEHLESKAHQGAIDWQVLKPDSRHTWLTEGLQSDFESFLPIGSKQAKAGVENAIFGNYGRGVATSRDTWAYNFDADELASNIKRMIEVYNDHVRRWQALKRKSNVDDFVLNDDQKISWSRDLKFDLQRENLAQFGKTKIRQSMYRPFTKSSLFFDRILNEEVYQFSQFSPEAETQNRIICCTDKGSEKPFMAFLVDGIADLHLVGAGSSTQCFPFYTYDEDGSHRQENITDWALEQFRSHYDDKKITKWDVFHYVYALLHHPAYRTKYEANLKRELPRILFAPDFWSFAKAGAKLADLHVNYEAQPEYKLKRIENPDEKLNWRVEKMKLSKDKQSLIYNRLLTLSGIPPDAFEYRLGNRCALEWIVDQY